MLVNLSVLAIKSMVESRAIGDSIPVKGVVYVLNGKCTIGYCEYAFFGLYDLRDDIRILIGCCCISQSFQMATSYLLPIKGEMVAFTPPKPSPMRTMDEANPPTPAPC